MGMLRYYYVSSHTINGAEGKVFYRDKIHANDHSLYYWKYAVHEVLNRDFTMPLYCTKDIICHHFQNLNTSRKSYIDLLKLDYEEQPNDPRALYNYGRELHHADRYKESNTVFTKFLDVSKNINERAHVYTLMGKNYFFTDNLGMAIEAFQNSIKEAPYFRMAYLELANMYLIKKDFIAALQAINQALSITERHLLFSDDPDAWNEKPYVLTMWALRELGMNKEALHYARLVEQLCPVYPKIHEIVAELQTLIEEK